MKKNSINTDGLRKLLPYGSIKVIANRSKTSIFTVSNVLKGESKNPIVLKTIKEYIEEIQQVNSELNALVTDSSTAC